MKKSIFLFAVISISVIGLSGCTTTGSSTDPAQGGLMSGLLSATGMNRGREAEIKKRETISVILIEDLKESREKLKVSKSQLEELEKRLSKTKHKTKSAKNRARKLATELRLKKQDLKNKSRELADLEQQIKTLKITKSSKKGTLEQLTQAKSELSSTKQEIAVLTDYLKEDLFIRAKNSLQYD